MKKEGTDAKRRVNPFAVAVAAIVVVALIIIHVKTNGVLFSTENILTLFNSMAVPTTMALGFAFVFASNITDLSPGAMVILTANVAGGIGNMFGVIPMVIATIIVGALCGLLNFGIYRATKVPPWIAGLGMTMVYEAIIGYYSQMRSKQGLKVIMLDETRRFLGQRPIVYLILILSIAAAYLIYNHTSAGLNLRAVGCNEKVADIMGINPTRALIISGMIAGAFFGFAGVMKESYAGYANSQSGLTSLSTTFQPMAAVLLAKALARHINYIIAVPIGVLVIVFVFNALTLLGVPSGTLQETLLGLVVVGFGIIANRTREGVVK